MTSLILFAIVVALLVLRQPVFLVLGVVVAFLYITLGSGRLSDITQDMFSALDHEVMLAVPLFIFAGNLMSRGSIAARLIAIAREMTSFVKGGLSVAGVVSCSLFAAISGSSVVTLLAIGKILYPALREEGYPKPVAIGVLVSAGTLGVIVPPSIPLILFGLVTQTSVTDLFLAGILPAALLAGVLSLFAIWRSRHIPSKAFSLFALLRAFKDGVFALLMPVIILGGIYSGIFTTTEAAAVAVLYALAVELIIFRDLNLVGIKEAAVETIMLLGVVAPILAVAVSLNQFLAFESIPQQLAQLVTDYAEGEVRFLLVVIVLLLVTGCVMDITPAILLLAPLLTPIAQSQGIDPIHFGIIMVVALEIGYITPPMGLNLFVACSAFNEKLGAVARVAAPFAIVMAIALLVIAFAPVLTTVFLS